MKQAVSLIILIALALSIQAGVASAQKKRPPPDEVLTIPSRTMTDEQFLKGEGESGQPVELSAELRLPNWETKLPLVILVHGSDGPTSGAVFAWRNFFERQGVATVRLDYFTGRGIANVERDQSQLGLLNSIYDAYRTVELVTADPRIDPSRIVLMGFSRGGIAALYGAMDRFQRKYGPKRGAIALYVPVYASCGLGLVDDVKLVHRPVRLFHGEADDWVPVAACQDFVQRAVAVGADVELAAYPGVRHAFDNPRAMPGTVIAEAPTPRRCQRKEVDGVITNAQTGQAFSYKDGCVELGPSVGYDKAAADQVGAAVTDLLRTLGK